MGKIGRRARRQVLRAEHLTPKTAELNDLGMVKMSDILLHVAEPLLKDLEMPEQEELFRRALSLGAHLWNASRGHTEEERREGLDLVLATLGAREDPEVEALLRKTFFRARRFHPRDPRLITHADLRVDERGVFRVSALTVMARPTTP